MMNSQLRLKISLRPTGYFAQRVMSFMICTLAAFISNAQSYQTEVEIMQEKFGLEKKVTVANFMRLGDEAEGFWEIYDEYELERKNLGKERIKVLIDYAESYPEISDEKILSLYKRANDIKKSFDKLQQKCFNQMKKEVGVSKAAQFWQLESYFNVMIQAEIYSQLPFIGEI
jgi:hypothetical protein